MAIKIFEAGPEQRVNTYTSGDQTYPQITSLEDGGWLVTWISAGQDGSGKGIYQQRFDAFGNPAGTETKVNTYTNADQEEAVVTVMPDGGWLVVWTSDNQDGHAEGIYQQRYAANGDPIGGETLVNTRTTSTQANASVATLKDGGWVVTWESYSQDGSDYGVYQQRYTSTGEKSDIETLVNTTTAGAQRYAQVTALNDGG